MAYTDPPLSLMDEEYLQEFTKLFNEAHPNHNVSDQEIYEMALGLRLAVQIIYKPILKGKNTVSRVIAAIFS